MFLLQSVTIEGFRGLPKRVEFNLGMPLVLIVGVNGTGKSSLACAIEWCLFGQEVETERRTGIRERAFWKARNLGSSLCSVDIEFTGNGETLLVHRSEQVGVKSDFWFRLGSSPPVREAGKLRALLGGLEIKDFFTAIHLHQESLRGLLLAGPTERKEDFYRMLGLASLLNQIEAIQDAKIFSLIKEVDKEFDTFEQALEGRVSSRQEDLKGARADYLSQGLPESDLTLEGKRTLWSTFVREVKKFCKTYSVEDSDLPASIPDSNANQIAKEQIRKLRSGCPVLQDRGALLARLNNVKGLKHAYREAENELNAAKQEIQILPPGERDLETLNKRILDLDNTIKRERENLTHINLKAAVLIEALTYFGKSLLTGKVECPVCKNETSVEDVQKHYEDEIQKGVIVPLEEKIKNLQRELNSAKYAKSNLESLQTEVDRKEKLLSAQRIKVVKVLGRQLAANDDPAALLAREIDNLDVRKSELDKQVAKVEEDLVNMEKHIDRLAKVLDVLRNENELAALGKVTMTETFQKLDSARLEVEEFGIAVNILLTSLKATMEADAEDRLNSVREEIGRMFEALTSRSDFPQLAVSADTKFAAQVEGRLGTADALSVLNQADMNCAALSIFLALAGAPTIHHKIGFLILDDSDQNLDEIHKERLAEVLSKICESRQVIVSTIQEDLCRGLQRRATKKKVVYRLSEWDYRNGPKIEKT